MLRQFWEGGPRRDPNTIAYVVLLVVAVLFPILVNVVTGGNSSAIIDVAADAGVYVLLAIGLNVVVGFAGLLDLGYAAFFAIGAYTYAFLASDHMRVTPLGEPIHVSFWFGSSFEVKCSHLISRSLLLHGTSTWRESR